MTKLASLLRVACLFLLWICACSFGFAQNPRGALRGTIQDASGARVPGAKITLRNPELALTRETQSDARGEFRVEGLPPASYVVTVDANLFAEARAEVTIPTSSVREINVSLQTKALAEKVLVTAPTQSVTTESLDTGSAVHEAVIYRQDLETIPLAARS
ncbi:MAG TPA: carboxypeptidase-like regulatory domain-containing protein, partial [Candidatus Acidoferrum sp.]